VVHMQLVHHGHLADQDDEPENEGREQQAVRPAAKQITVGGAARPGRARPLGRVAAQIEQKRDVEGVDGRARRLVPGGAPAAAGRILARHEMTEDDEQDRQSLATIKVPSPPAMLFHAMTIS
jgi:hypothetical protein